MKFPGQFAPDKPPPPILIVDDEDIVLAALKETLRRANFDCVPVSDPLKAVEEIKNREFSVIIPDQRMPGFPGLKLLAQAREKHPTTTRILVTAVLDLDTVIDAINKGE